MSDEVTRHSVLESRHRDLGSPMGNWNGMDVPWEYGSNPEDEHDAVRTAAGLFDVSGLKKIFVRGPDALAVVDHVITRDMTRIPPGRSAYGPTLTEEGTICDDAIIFNLGDNEYLVVHGSGHCMARLRESAQGKDVEIAFDDDLHDISLQGPKATAFLDRFTPLDLQNLGYFHQARTTVFGHPAIVSRTGYSGERGYEIFARAEHITDIWDQILGKGASEGIVPCSFTCLDKIRVEAGLLFYPYDMTEEHSPWDVGLGWAVSKNGDYRGKDAAMALKGKEKIAVVTLDVDLGDALAAGETLLVDGKGVGVVNSPVYSHRMKKSLALGHIDPAHSAPGTRVQVEGDGVSCTATVVSTPIYDPEKTRTHS